MSKELLPGDREPAPEGACGGSSAELAGPKSCLKKKKKKEEEEERGERDERVKGVAWKGSFEVITREGKEIEVLVEGWETTPGRTLQELMEEAEALQRTFALKEKDKQIIKRAKKYVWIMMEKSLSFPSPVDFVKGVRNNATKKFETVRDEMLDGKPVHDYMLFLVVFLANFIKF